MMARINIFAVFFFISSICGSLTAIPTSNYNLTDFPYQTDYETGLKFFWFEGEDGSRIKAFVEGGEGPTTKAIEDDVHFYLYTLKNKDTPQELKVNCDSCLKNSNFDTNAPVKIICHGFMSDYQSNINVEMKNAYFLLGNNVNVIILNWERLAAAPWYDNAAANTKPVGVYASSFVNYLVTSGYTSFSKIHFSGHSLGSHVGGHVGSNTNQKIARLTGLDPALPLFGNMPDSERIDPSDAEYVDVIHTAGTDLGFHEARGHVDYYPNNGKAYQPGCGIDLISTCSHGRCYQFMAESIWHQNGFPSYKCNSWEDYDQGRCSMTEKAYMGEPSSLSARGKYFLRTNANAPYGQE